MNKQKKYIGWTDSPLSKEGAGQLEDIKQSMAEYDVCYTSDLNRCIETTRRLFPGRKPSLLPEFREIYFGLWEGKTHLELEADEMYQNWLASPFTVSPPEGETFFRFTERIEAGWKKVTEEMASLSAGRAAIITHGGVIRYLLMTYAPVERGFWDWSVPHGRGFELLWPIEAYRRGERCTLLREVPLTGNLPG